MRSVRFSWVVFVLAAVLPACPSPPVAARDGGMPCTALEHCNRSGQTCGALYLCLLGFCAQDTVERACDDGGYPDTGAVVGDCVTPRDCNPPGACGSGLIDCINERCDRTAPLLSISCRDGGSDVIDAGGSDVVYVTVDTGDVRDVTGD